MTLETILDASCEKFNAKQRDIVSKTRRKEVVLVRHIVMYLCKKYTKLSISQIGRSIGGRDHSTVIHACNTIERRLASEKNFRLDMEKFEATLKVAKK